MSKILGGIPTRGRSTSGRIADVLAEVCDEVVVISQGAVCNYTAENVVVLERDPNWGVVNARNAILDYAIDNNFDYMIESDDDISYPPETISAMLDEIIDDPHIGAISSASRAYFNWAKDTKPNKNYILSACATQLWAARTRIMKQVGYFSLPHLEDREHGCRMWKCGYPIVQLHIDISYAHNVFIPRTSKKKYGGQEEKVGETDQYEDLKKSIDFMNKRHSDVVWMKFLGLKGRSFQTRYNWETMLQYAILAKNCLGYKDARGRYL